MFGAGSSSLHPNAETKSGNGRNEQRIHRREETPDGRVCLLTTGGLISVRQHHLDMPFACMAFCLMADSNGFGFLLETTTRTLSMSKTSSGCSLVGHSGPPTHKCRGEKYRGFHVCFKGVLKEVHGRIVSSTVEGVKRLSLGIWRGRTVLHRSLKRDRMLPFDRLAPLGWIESDVFES